MFFGIFCLKQGFDFIIFCLKHGFDFMIFCLKQGIDFTNFCLIQGFFSRTINKQRVRMFYELMMCTMYLA